MLLLLMTDVTLLIQFGYIPYTVVGLFTRAEISKVFLEA